MQAKATLSSFKFSQPTPELPVREKAWGLTQFTVEDLDGNRFYFHRD
jgi:hypothetical protein